MHSQKDNSTSQLPVNSVTSVLGIFVTFPGNTQLLVTSSNIQKTLTNNIIFQMYVPSQRHTQKEVHATEMSANSSLLFSRYVSPAQELKVLHYQHKLGDKCPACPESLNATRVNIFTSEQVNLNFSMALSQGKYTWKRSQLENPTLVTSLNILQCCKNSPFL